MHAVTGPPIIKDPLRYLTSVHRRMGEEMGKLVYYVEWKSGAQLTEIEEIDIRTTLGYLSRMIPLHTGDETGSLFPHILGTGDASAEGAAPILARLESDQHDLIAQYAEVDRLFRKWIAAGSLTFKDVWELGRLTKQLRLTHKRHVRLEESEVFPLAEKVLCADCRSGIVHEMLERRGLEEPIPL